MKKPNTHNPFKTPEGYFDKLTDDLMAKLEEPTTELPSKDGFVVPENYFEGLHEKITEKLDSDTKVVRLHSYRRYYWTAASVAAVLLVFFGVQWNTREQPDWSTIASTEIEAYFEINDLELTTYEIAEVLPIDELEINEILENQFIEEDVVEYLNENIEDIEDLNLEDYD